MRVALVDKRDEGLGCTDKITGVSIGCKASAAAGSMGTPGVPAGSRASRPAPWGNIC